MLIILLEIYEIWLNITVFKSCCPYFLVALKSDKCNWGCQIPSWGRDPSVPCSALKIRSKIRSEYLGDLLQMCSIQNASRISKYTLFYKAICAFCSFLRTCTINIWYGFTVRPSTFEKFNCQKIMSDGASSCRTSRSGGERIQWLFEAYKSFVNQTGKQCKLRTINFPPLLSGLNAVLKRDTRIKRLMPLTMNKMKGFRKFSCHRRLDYSLKDSLLIWNTVHTNPNRQGHTNIQWRPLMTAHSVK